MSIQDDPISQFKPGILTVARMEELRVEINALCRHVAELERERGEPKKRFVPYRMKVKTAANSSGVAIANTIDQDDTVGTIDYPVVSSAAVDAVIFAAPVSNTGKTYPVDPPVVLDDGSAMDKQFVKLQEVAIPTFFWFRITAASQDGSNKRWVYSGTQVYKNTNGYGGWSDVSGGVTTTKLYNIAEDQNGASGTYGNGVSSTNLTGTIDIKALPTARRVLARLVTTTDGTVEYWFEDPNGVDGACS